MPTFSFRRMEFHHFQVMGRIWNSWHVLESTPWKQVWGNGAIFSFPGHPVELWTPVALPLVASMRFYLWFTELNEKSTNAATSLLDNGKCPCHVSFFSYMCLFYPFLGGILRDLELGCFPETPGLTALASCRWSRACRLAPQWWMKCLWVTMSWAQNHRSWACVVIAVQMLCFAGYLKFDPYLNGGQCWLIPPCTETQRIIPFLAINAWQTRPENYFRDWCHLEHYLWHWKITLKNSLHTDFTNWKKTQKFCWSRGSDNPYDFPIISLWFPHDVQVSLSKIPFSRSGAAIAATDGSIRLFGGMFTSGFGRGPRKLHSGGALIRLWPFKIC